MALDCENVAYISKYPDKNAKSRLLPAPPSFHKQYDDKEYGDPSTKICFDCVDENKIKEWYEKNKTKDYFWGSASCIEAVFDALKYSLPQEEKPKCECTPWYSPFIYIVGDRLNRGEMNPEDYPFIVPQSLVQQLKRFAKDCKRYECIKYNFVLKAYYF